MAVIVDEIATKIRVIDEASVEMQKIIANLQSMEKNYSRTASTVSRPLERAGIRLFSSEIFMLMGNMQGLNRLAPVVAGGVAAFANSLGALAGPIALTLVGISSLISIMRSMGEASKKSIEESVKFAEGIKSLTPATEHALRLKLEAIRAEKEHISASLKTTEAIGKNEGAVTSVTEKLKLLFELTKNYGIGTLKGSSAQEIAAKTTETYYGKIIPLAESLRTLEAQEKALIDTLGGKGKAMLAQLEIIDAVRIKWNEYALQTEINQGNITEIVRLQVQNRIIAEEAGFRKLEAAEINTTKLRMASAKALSDYEKSLTKSTTEDVVSKYAKQYDWLIKMSTIFGTFIGQGLAGMKDAWKSAIISIVNMWADKLKKMVEMWMFAAVLLQPWRIPIGLAAIAAISGVQAGITSALSSRAAGTAIPGVFTAPEAGAGAIPSEPFGGVAKGVSKGIPIASAGTAQINNFYITPEFKIQAIDPGSVPEGQWKAIATKIGFYIQEALATGQFGLSPAV